MEYDLSRVKAVQWGVQNEAEAINHFRKFTGLPVAETGIWLDPKLMVFLALIRMA